MFFEYHSLSQLLEASFSFACTIATAIGCKPQNIGARFPLAEDVEIMS